MPLLAKNGAAIRWLSWGFGLLSWIGAPLWWWTQITAFDRWAETQPQGVCGMPAMAMAAIAVLAAALFSLLALFFGSLALSRLPPPGPSGRKAELAALALPLLTAILLLAYGFATSG
jgi:hypothetical protein